MTLLSVEVNFIHTNMFFLVGLLRKNCLVVIMPKNCTFKLEVEKSLIVKKNHSHPPPPGIKWSVPYVSILANNQAMIIYNYENLIAWNAWFSS